MAKDNICVIYDDDESYAKRLMGIINDSKDIPYRAKVFTKEEEFNRYILANKTDVLMVNEEQYTYGINHEDIKTDDNSVIVLCEDEKEAGIINDKKEKGLIGVCKYQPAYQLLGSITRQRPDRTQRVEDITRYIGVYGFNSTLRVTLAMVIAAAYSKKGRTLFINLDEFSGIEHIMMSDGCSNLSDVFYMFKQAGEHFTQQIRECIKANELFDYIPAVVCADDISYVNDRLISGLLDELAHNLKYDYIVVNISEGINKPWSIMGRCSNVYISDSGDYIENCRFNNLKRYFIESGKEAIVDRMPNYPEIQYAVEYSIYNLCSLTLNTCITIGQSDAAFIQKQRLKTIQYYINNYIRLPISDNKYIQNKMSKENIKLIHNIDLIISRLG